MQPLRVVGIAAQLQGSGAWRSAQALHDLTHAIILRTWWQGDYFPFDERKMTTGPRPQFQLGETPPISITEGDFIP
jgi:hypothetical protein